MKVQDFGLGIPEKDQPDVFKKFRKLSARPTGGESSNRLGLSIVKNLVEKPGGEISFFSREGGGTTFQVLLPHSGFRMPDLY